MLMDAYFFQFGFLFIHLADRAFIMVYGSLIRNDLAITSLLKRYWLVPFLYLRYFTCIVISSLMTYVVRFDSYVMKLGTSM